MNKYLIAIALLLNPHFAAAFAPSTYDLPNWFKQSFLEIKEDVEEAGAGKKRVILFFGQNGCPYCKKLVEGNWSDSAIADYTRKHFDVIALNIVGAREVKWTDGKVRTEKELAEHLRVRATPTLVFLDEQGNIAERTTGYDRPAEFLALLKKAAPKKS